MITLNNIINILTNYWKKNGCVVLYSIDLEVGAATSHYYTFFKSLYSNSWSSIYLQNCRRSQDFNCIHNSNKLQKYYQIQVILKPIPKNIIYLYIKSLKKLNLSLFKNNINFLEDNWENPSLGALGIGWEIWINNLEISQFTFFRQMGGLPCKPIVEITYGLERLSLILQKKKNVFDLFWDKFFKSKKYITYKNLNLLNEINFSIYNYNIFNIGFIFNLFNLIEIEAKRLIYLKIIIPSYDLVLKLCNLFNSLDSKNILFYYNKIYYIKRIRFLSCSIARLYLNQFI